jgi:hypothetical protein
VNTTISERDFEMMLKQKRLLLPIWVSHNSISLTCGYWSTAVPLIFLPTMAVLALCMAELH